MRKLIAKFGSNKKIEKITNILQYIFLFFYVFSLPSFSARVSFNLISYFAMALLAIATLFKIVCFNKPKFQWHLLLLPTFVLLSFISTAIFSKDFRGWLTLAMLTITFFVFYFTFYSINNVFLGIKIIVFAFLLFCLYFIFVYFKDIINYKNFTNNDFRLGDYFDNVNHIGSYLSTALTLSLFIAFFSSKKIDLLFLAPSIVFILVGLTTGSRSFVSVCVLSFLILISYKFRKKKILLAISFVGFLVITIIVINLPALELLKKRIVNFFQTLFSGDGNDTSTIQRYLWQRYGFYLSFKQIILGYGREGFALYSGVGTYTHANLSEMLCDYGIFGTMSFYIAILYPLIATLKIEVRKNYKIVIITFATLFVFRSFISIFYYDKATYLIFALMYYINDFERKSTFAMSYSNIFNHFTYSEVTI